MTIKERLLKLRRINERIKGLEQDKQDMLTIIKTVDYCKDSVQSSDMTDISDILDKIDRYERLIVESIDDLVDRKTILRPFVDKALTGKQWEVVNYYYFCNDYTWEKIAVALDCSYQNVHMLHGRALKKLAEVDSLLQKNVI